MNKLWSDRAWDDYLYWQAMDKKVAILTETDICGLLHAEGIMKIST